MGTLFTKPWFIFTCCSGKDRVNLDEKQNEELFIKKNNSSSESNLSILSSSGSDCPRILSVDDLNNLVVIVNKKTY